MRLGGEHRVADLAGGRPLVMIALQGRREPISKCRRRPRRRSRRVGGPRIGGGATRAWRLAQEKVRADAVQAAERRLATADVNHPGRQDVTGVPDKP